MLKKANQKRYLDNLVIQKGQFTTDFFRKTHWKDWLGDEAPEEAGDAGIDQKGDNAGNGGDDGEDLTVEQEGGDAANTGDIFGSIGKYESALQQVEDEADVVALKQASREIQGADKVDFSEENLPPVVAEAEPAPIPKPYLGGVEAYMFKWILLEWEWQEHVTVEDLFTGVDL